MNLHPSMPDKRKGGFYRGFLDQRFSIRTGAVTAIVLVAVAYYLLTHKLTAEMATMLGLRWAQDPQWLP